MRAPLLEAAAAESFVGSDLGACLVAGERWAGDFDLAELASGVHPHTARDDAAPPPGLSARAERGTTVALTVGFR
jgi:hypothetical protein